MTIIMIIMMTIMINMITIIKKIGVLRDTARVPTRLEICQKIYTTGFLGQKFYTLKMRKLRLSLPTMKQRKSLAASALISEI